MQTGSHGAARLAWYAAPICLAGLAALLYFGVTGESSAPMAGSVQVAGSESMRPVVTACAEDFMTRNPQSDIIVRGGGSGDGVAALLYGLVDIGMASRDLTNGEQDFAKSKGIEISSLALARDGIVVIVNHVNPIAQLHFIQLQDIFTGKVRDWHELEGKAGEVVVFARAAGSGTASLFNERVMDDAVYAQSVQRLSTNEAIVAQVAARPGAIGYADLGALRSVGNRIRPVAVRAPHQNEGVAPRPEAIRSGDYPLARTLNLVAAGQPAGAAKAFLEYCMSASGQALVQRAGYVAARSASQ